MKLKYILFLGLVALQALADDSKPATPPPAPGAQATPAPAPEIPDKDKLSYAIGMNLAINLKRFQADVDVDTIASAVKAVLSGAPTRFTDLESSELIKSWQAGMMAKRAQQAKEKVKAADNFRANFGKEPGVITLPDGLLYKVIKEGTGPLAKASDMVTMSYKGTFIDGTDFDHNDSFITPVTGRTIKGWSEAMQLMKVGSKFHVVIPPDLAYGDMGQQPKIPPKSTLIFDMELISIQAPAAGATQSLGQVVSGEIIKVPSAEELKKGAKIEVIKAEDIKDGKVVSPK